MKRWIVWAVMASLLLLAAAFTFMNFFAAVDLGYEMYPGGKDIIRRHACLTAAFLASSSACAFVAWRTRRGDARRTDRRKA
jgi:predicted Co/Zn/Cd cation transporter (cation efflux family)